MHALRATACRVPSLGENASPDSRNVRAQGRARTRTLLTAPEDIPCGRPTAVADPDGAVFKLMATCGLMPGAES
jgi:hypothetical protein